MILDSNSKKEYNNNSQYKKHKLFLHSPIFLLVEMYFSLFCVY